VSWVSRASSLLRSVGGALARNSGAVTTIVFLAALAPRLWVATRWSGEPVWDGHYYHFGAERIATGHGYSDDVATPDGLVWHPWCHYPVGYSAYLAAFYFVLGASPTVGTAAGALAGAVTAAVVHRLALSFLGPARALVAGLGCALHPGLILYSAVLMTEPLAALGLVLAPLAYLALSGRPRLAPVVSGVIFGLTTLVRPQTILCVPAIALLGEGKGLRGRVVAAAIAMATSLAVVAPWTARNCVQMDGCAFVSTNAGWNLAIGSSPRATGRFEPLKAEDGCRIVTGQVQQDRCWRDQGLAWIRQDPARWLALAPRKLAFTFDHQSFAVGYLAQADPGAWPEERRAAWRARLGIFQYGLLFVAALGAILLPVGRKKDVALASGLAAVLLLFADGVMRDAPRIWPLVLAIPVLSALPPFDRRDKGVVRYLAFCLTTLVVVHAVFFGEDRYQIVLTPALFVLAAAALRWADPEGVV
jgi:hypothetical protein